MNGSRRHKKRGGWRTVKFARVAVSVVSLAALTTLFTFGSASVAESLGWMAHAQIVPLALAGAGGALAFWFGATLLFGRLYCSWFCPMGVVQDCFGRLRRLTRAGLRRHPYHWHPGNNRFRYAFVALVVASAVAGLPLLLTLFDPYSAFGRIASELVLPVKEFLAGEPVVVGSWLAFAIAAATVAAVGFVLARRGRLVCNTMCPVGSTLSVLSRYSLFHFEIDTDLCVNCRRCEHNCKSECINMADHVVDSSRCVACFNCVDVCENNAVKYTFRHKKLSLPLMQPVNRAPAASVVKAGDASDVCDVAGPVRIDRRKFLAAGLLVAATPVLGAVERGRRSVDAVANGSSLMPQLRAAAPPGRRSMAEFLERCTGCGLCVARCPSKVLRPSVNELGWLNMLHPVLDYDRSYCLYDCTQCTDACPSGALMPLTVEEKHIFIIGRAMVAEPACIGCGQCERACPRDAVEMVPRAGGRGRKARVKTELCIGCGACHHVCPARPDKAIWVEGIV